MNLEELSAIFDYIEDYKDIKHSEFLFDIQKLINYIQEENYNNEQNIKDIIKQIPPIIHLEKISQFINDYTKEGGDNKKLFTVNSLIDFYNLFEHLCWDEIKANINNEFKKTLEDEKKYEIRKYFDDLNPNCIINKLNLSTAIRRFISKYLSGLTNDNDKSEKNLLIPELSRADLWDYSFVDHPYFQKEMEKINNKLKITIGYAMDLYEVLGGDEILKTNLRKTVKKDLKDDNKDKQSQIIKNDKKTVGRINNSGLSQTRKGAMKKKIKRREKA